MKEIWKDIEGYEGLYQISNMGKVKSLSRKMNKYTTRLLKLTKDKKGYTICSLYNKGLKTHKVHRLVAKAFIPNPNNYPMINHIDGNKQNNNLNNLEWCDNSYNQLHAIRNGLKVYKIGVNNKHSIPIIQIDKNGKKIKEWACAKDVYRELGYDNSRISKVCKNGHFAYGFKWVYK